MICRRENDFVSSAGHSGHKVSLLKKFSTEKPRRIKERRMKKFKKDIILFFACGRKPSHRDHHPKNALLTYWQSA